MTEGRGLEDALGWDAARWDAAGWRLRGEFWTLRGSHSRPAWSSRPCSSSGMCLPVLKSLTLCGIARPRPGLSAQVVRGRHWEPRHQPRYCSARAAVRVWALIPCAGLMDGPCARSRGCVTWVNSTSPLQQSVSQALTQVRGG